jgi:hypothetical protein
MVHDLVQASYLEKRKPNSLVCFQPGEDSDEGEMKKQKKEKDNY